MPGGEKGILDREVISRNHWWPDPPWNILISSHPIKPEQQELQEFEDRFIRVSGWESPIILIDPLWIIPWQRQSS